MSDNRLRLDTHVEPSLDDSRSEELAATSHWLLYLEATYKLFLQSDDYDRELYKPPLEEYFRKHLLFMGRLLSLTPPLVINIVLLSQKNGKIAYYLKLKGSKDGPPS
jgi:hypothetical protein